MKMTFFSVRDDEISFIHQFSQKYDIDVTICKKALTLNNVDLCANSQAVSIMTTKTDEAIIKELHKLNVQYISTRTIGFDHIDLKACEKYGIHVGNVSYSLGSVAEYTIMMILMSLRNTKLILERFSSQDFSLNHIRGRELTHLTVGVIGTGKIGQEVIRLLSSFSCHIIAYDVHPNEKLKDTVKYVDLETLYKQSHIITLHAPNVDETYHMINKETIALMRDDVIIINTARGTLINTEDLIEALENKKIGYAALDVVENESHLYYRDLKNKILDNRNLAILRSFPNVLLTPHTAFFTHQAVSDMVEYSMMSASATIRHEDNPWLII